MSSRRRRLRSPGSPAMRSSRAPITSLPGWRPCSYVTATLLPRDSTHINPLDPSAVYPRPIPGLTIGIDARAATEEIAGSGRVVRELIRALAARDDPYRYRL